MESERDVVVAGSDTFGTNGLRPPRSYLMTRQRPDVMLMTDNAGVPGTVMEAWHFSGQMAALGDPNSPLSAASVLNPLLTAGTQYRLVVSTTGPDAHAAWHFNSVGDVGPLASRTDLGPWGASNDTRGAFRIIGTAAGEPWDAAT